MRPLLTGYYGYWVILTYLSVAAAVAGMSFAVDGNIKCAVICLMVCGVCDMFDGPVARLKKRTVREEAFGIQIDSLADIVSFGVFPAVIGYAIISDRAALTHGYPGTIAGAVILSAYVLAALIRLAYFNVIEMELQNKRERRKYYEGLPVTSAALIIPIAYIVCARFDFPLPEVYAALLVFLSIAFVAKIKIPKLKLCYLAIFCLIGLPIVIYIFLSNGK